MHKVLIFGAGPRTKRTILPALSIVNPDIKIEFVTLSGKQFVSEDIESNCFKFGSEIIDYSNYDLILISVPPAQVSKILESIGNVNNYKILIDTPVTRDVYLNARKTNVKVMQDIKFLPFLDLVQKYGNINNVLMRFSGYEYHGVALAKHLIDTKVVKSKRYRNSERDELLIYFDKNKKVIIKNPRNYDIGYIEINYQNNEKLVIGNKSTYKDFENSSRYVDGEDLITKDKDFQKQIHPLNNKINSTNFIESIHSFKLLGLSTMFFEAFNDGYEDLPSVSSCYDDYKITYTITIFNRIKWKIKKVLKSYNLI